MNDFALFPSATSPASRGARRIACVRWLVPAAVFLLSTACGIGAAPSQRTITDDGTACLSDPDSNEEGRLEPGPLTVRVTFNTCISSTCDEVDTKTCSVSVNGATVAVESEAVILNKGGTCTADCGFVSTTCEVPSLEAGDYTLTHGSATTSFSLPTNDDVCASTSS